MSLQGFYTTKGLTLAAKIAAGTKLTITKVTAGSGQTAESASVLTQEKQTLTVGTAHTGSRTAILPVTIAEVNAASSYSLTELGVYAGDPDVGEILYQVFRMDEARSVAAGGENVYRFYLKETVGAGNVTVSCSPAGLITEAELKPVYADLAKKPDAVQSERTLYVAKTGNDTTADGSEAKPYQTIQAAIDSLPRVLLGYVTIVIHAGSYDENVKIERFSGAAGLSLTGVAGETVQIKSVYAAYLNFGNCLWLRNLHLTGVCETGYGWTFFANACSYVQLADVSCVNEVTQASYGALTFHYVPTARLLNVTVSNKPVALDLCASTVYLNNTVTGESNTVGIRCGSGWAQAGGFVQKGGATIAGEEQKGLGGQIW